MQDLTNYDHAYYHRDQPEYWFQETDLLRPDQLAALCYALNWPFWDVPADMPPPGPRNAGLIYSIGCGIGVLERKLERIGYRVIGVDPSPAPFEEYKGSELIESYPGGGNTVIFCESVEHIPLDDLLEMFTRIPIEARVIVVNWPDGHPIHPEEPYNDHITLVDDDLYDRLSEGRKVLLRRGSHLVMEGPA